MSNVDINIFGEIEDIEDTKEKFVKKSFGDKIPWQLKWEPKSLNDLILSDTIRNKFDFQMNQSRLKNCTLHGSAGMGKTTLAKMLAKEMNAPFKFYNASQMKIDVLRDEFMAYSSQYIVGPPTIVVLDECDRANSETFWNALRSVIDATLTNVIYVLTGNYIFNIPEAILSRCKPIAFDHTDLNIKRQIFNRLKLIAKTETDISGGTYDENTLKQIARKCFPDIRLMINTMEDVFDTNKGSIIGDPIVSSDIHLTELYKYLLAGSDIEARTYFNEKITDYSTFFINFCNFFEKTITNKDVRLTIANAFAEFNYRSTQGVNQELNITKGLFTHLMWALKNVES